jgi:hypothetical protein
MMSVHQHVGTFMSVTVSSFFVNMVEHYLLLLSTYQMVDFVASFSLVLLVMGASHEMLSLYFAFAA